MAQIPTTITGNLTGDVHLKELPNGSRVARFRVAASRSYRDQQNNWVSTDHLFITIDCWNQLADNAKQSLDKGMPIIAVGTLLTNEWKGRDGTDQQQILLRANHLGVDMTRFVVSSARPGGGKTVAGVPAPETSRPVADEVVLPRDQTNDGGPAAPQESASATGFADNGSAATPGAEDQPGEAVDGERELVGAVAESAPAEGTQEDGGDPPF